MSIKVLLSDFWKCLSATTLCTYTVDTNDLPETIENNRPFPVAYGCLYGTAVFHGDHVDINFGQQNCTYSTMATAVSTGSVKPLQELSTSNWLHDLISNQGDVVDHMIVKTSLGFYNLRRQVVTLFDIEAMYDLYKACTSILESHSRNNTYDVGSVRAVLEQFVKLNTSDRLFMCSVNNVKPEDILHTKQDHAKGTLVDQEYIPDHIFRQVEQEVIRRQTEAMVEALEEATFVSFDHNPFGLDLGWQDADASSVMNAYRRGDTNDMVLAMRHYLSGGPCYSSGICSMLRACRAIPYCPTHDPIVCDAPHPCALFADIRCVYCSGSKCVVRHLDKAERICPPKKKKKATASVN